MTSQQFLKLKFPDSPGVYFFLGQSEKEILYIGKATSLRTRVRSYFLPDIVEKRSVAIRDMILLSQSVIYEKTDTALEALLLEAELIKKYAPKYNTKEKDNKSFNYVIITSDPIPKVELIRGRTLKVEKELKTIKPKYIFGPFSNAGAIREALKIIRRIFPYIDKRSITKDNYEFYKQIGLTPDTNNKEGLEEYKNHIKHIVLFFQGKKKSIIVELKKAMLKKAKKLKFEDANAIKKQVFALEHINDVSVIKEDFLETHTENIKDFRIEGYDIAHLSGKSMVGVMTVVANKAVDKTEYKKFIIRTQKSINDVGALYEVLMRRLKHTEWGMPDLIVVDGGIPQIRVAQQVCNFYQIKIPIVSVLKDEKHKPKDILGDKDMVKGYKKEILLVNSEAHRFAISFHKEKRAKSFIPK